MNKECVGDFVQTLYCFPRLHRDRFVAAIAACLRRIAADPTLRSTLVERGRDNVRRFSWAACAQSAWDVIHGCMPGASTQTVV